MVDLMWLILIVVFIVVGYAWHRSDSSGKFVISLLIVAAIVVFMHFIGQYLCTFALTMLDELTNGMFDYSFWPHAWQI